MQHRGAHGERHLKDTRPTPPSTEATSATQLHPRFNVVCHSRSALRHTTPEAQCCIREAGRSDADGVATRLEQSASCALLCAQQQHFRHDYHWKSLPPPHRPTQLMLGDCHFGRTR